MLADLLFRGATTTLQASPTTAWLTQYNFSNAAFKVPASRFLFHALAGKIHGLLSPAACCSRLYHILLVLGNTLQFNLLFL
jgi:hypothetical protein